MITNASSSPNSAATTPSIGAEISAWNPSRVDGTVRRTSHTAPTTTAIVSTTAASSRTAIGTVLRTPRTTIVTLSAERRVARPNEQRQWIRRSIAGGEDGRFDLETERISRAGRA